MLAWFTLAAHAGPPPLSGAGLPGTPWWDPAWAYRAPVLRAADRTTETILAELAVEEGENGFSRALASRDDLRLVLDGAVVPTDIEAFDGPYGTALWAALPPMGTASTLYLYFGNPSPYPGAPALDWAGFGYNHVWHLTDCLNGSCPDVAGGVPLETQDSTVAPGLAADGLELDDSGGSYARYVGVLYPPYSFSLWILVDDPVSRSNFLQVDGFALGVLNETFVVNVEGTTSFGDHVAAGTWHHVLAVVDDYNVQVSVDGGQDTVAGIYANATGEILVGRDEDDVFLGTVDEFRLTLGNPIPVSASEYLGGDGFLTLGPTEPRDPTPTGSGGTDTGGSGGNTTVPPTSGDDDDATVDTGGEPPPGQGVSRALLGGKCATGSAMPPGAAAVAIALTLMRRRCTRAPSALDARVVRGVWWRRRRTWPGW